jgi:hypothetical protein
MASTIASSRPSQAAAEHAVAARYTLLTYGLSAALAATAAVAAAFTAFASGILTGPAVMNGSARGTALVTLFVGVPALIAGLVAAARGWDRAPLLWLGALGFLTYNGFMFLAATPFNQLFLVYEAMFGLAIWSVVALLRQVDVEGLAGRLRPLVPARAIAAYSWVIIGLNAALWLSGAVAAVLSDDPGRILAGTGVATVPTYFQDLAFWIPLTTVAAAWLWRRNRWGYLVSGALLTMSVIEAISVALDQWMGSAADPASTVASATVTPIFAALAVIGLVPLYFFYVRRSKTPAAS